MTAGDIYTIAGNGGCGLSGDGGPATAATLCITNNITVDPAGNVLITQGVDPAVRVVAAATGTFYGQTMTAGDIYTIAGNGNSGYSGDGGPATSATFTFPEGVGVDRFGNVLIGDTENSRVRVVAEHTGTFYGVAMTTGDIYTVAGTGNCGYNGDGIPATTANVCGPGGVPVDSAGNLVIADGGNRRIRVVPDTSGTYYGQAMTAGDIYTIAGNGTAGCAGNGGPATAAEIGGSQGVSDNAAGDLIISDAGCREIRQVRG
jgi:hypothetical protein